MAASDLDTIVAFLREIGLTVEERTIEHATILPGITVEQGHLVIDREKLLYPGDLLHEAGHLAVVPKAEREALGWNVGTSGGLEMGAIGWSYAACLHIGLPPEVVFHPHGYKDSSHHLLQNFQKGQYLGAPILSWRGLANDLHGSEPHYPTMKKWLAD